MGGTAREICDKKNVISVSSGKEKLCQWKAPIRNKLWLLLPVSVEYQIPKFSSLGYFLIFRAASAEKLENLKSPLVVRKLKQLLRAW